MIRKIKFRGKDLDGQFVYGNLHRNASSTKCWITATEQWNTVDKMTVCKYLYTKEIFEVNPKTVGQFTGLTDKNGVEIYEGDILTIDSISANTHVEFIDGCFWLSYDEKDNEQILPLYEEIRFGLWKVIGNIHENQKMLNSK